MSSGSSLAGGILVALAGLASRNLVVSQQQLFSEMLRLRHEVLSSGREALPDCSGPGDDPDHDREGRPNLSKFFVRCQMAITGRETAKGRGESLCQPPAAGLRPALSAPQWYRITGVCRSTWGLLPATLRPLRLELHR